MQLIISFLSRFYGYLTGTLPLHAIFNPMSIAIYSYRFIIFNFIHLQIITDFIAVIVLIDPFLKNLVVVCSFTDCSSLDCLFSNQNVNIWSISCMVKGCSHWNSYFYYMHFRWYYLVNQFFCFWNILIRTVCFHPKYKCWTNSNCFFSWMSIPHGIGLILYHLGHFILFLAVLSFATQLN